MIRKSLARAGLVSAVVFGAVVCAQAQVNLFVVSSGTATQSGGIISASETVLLMTGGNGALGTFNYQISDITDLGFGTYTGAGGTLDIDIAFDPGSLKFVAPSSSSLDGTWMYAGGTGGYSGFTSGGGTLSYTLLVTSPTTATAGTTLSGTLNAVPEPSAIAAMGVGIVGLLVRRRRQRA